jgi:hypothetical protein
VKRTHRQGEKNLKKAKYVTDIIIGKIKGTESEAHEIVCRIELQNGI